ncbi:STAS domain-containing protein [Streptomyces sp. NPDC007205]|uniref:STAS domain-containing protein n=1 Tax=Streptomyces sp. NPDC007205 TaxID=3154316 RepID=UPI0033D33BFF
MFRQGEVASVGIFGELDLYTGGELKTILAECLDGRPARLVVDVSAVSFCDLTGATALAEARDRAVQAGTEFMLSGVRTPTLVRILTLTGLDGAFVLPQPYHCSPTRPGSATWEVKGGRRWRVRAALHESVLGRRHRYVRRAAVSLWRSMGNRSSSHAARAGGVVWWPLGCSQ